MLAVNWRPYFLSMLSHHMGQLGMLGDQIPRVSVCREPTGSWIAFYDLALDVMPCHSWCAFCLPRQSQSLAQVQEEEKQTLPLKGSGQFLEGNVRTENVAVVNLEKTACHRCWQPFGYSHDGLCVRRKVKDGLQGKGLLNWADKLRSTERKHIWSESVRVLHVGFSKGDKLWGERCLSMINTCER